MIFRIATVSYKERCAISKNCMNIFGFFPIDPSAIFSGTDVDARRNWSINTAFSSRGNCFTSAYDISTKTTDFCQTPKFSNP